DDGHLPFWSSGRKSVAQHQANQLRRERVRNDADNADPGRQCHESLSAHHAHGESVMRHSSNVRLRTAGILSLAAFSTAAVSTAAAQQLNTSAGAAGVGGNYVPRARGFEVVAWNPANLGLPGNGGFSIAILPATASFTLDPITLADIKSVQDNKAPN